jgi:hypothetical protein
MAVESMPKSVCKRYEHVTPQSPCKKPPEEMPASGRIWVWEGPEAMAMWRNVEECGGFRAAINWN